MRHENWLHSLARSGRRAATVGDAGINWDSAILKPRWMPTRAYVTAISQLYYGELATIEICEKLINHVDDSAARGFIATQIADERRHVFYYDRYLRRLGGIGDIEEGVAMAYDGARAWPGSHHGAILACHVILEGDGVATQRLYGDWFRCPLFKQMNALIARDEGRHVAFGRHYLKNSLGGLPLEERLAIFRWIRSLWFDCAAAIRAEMPWSAALLVGREWAQQRWWRQQRTMTNIGLIHHSEIGTFDRV